MTSVITLKQSELLSTIHGSYPGINGDHHTSIFNESNGLPSLLHQTPSEGASSYGETQISRNSLGLDRDIIDIRRNGSSPFDLRAKTVEGLCQPFGSKFLPSLLLWDSKGQSFYGDILNSKYYYPYYVENKLLKQTVHQIANKIALSGTQVTVELGAGNMHKTALLLSVLDNFNIPLTYYALDVDPIELKASLNRLRARTELRNIQVRGLLGTYEDGSHWLGTAPETRHTRKALVWLGNSIANFTRDEASKVLGSFINNQTDENFSGVVLGVDGCRDEAMIECAYDTPGGQSRRWVKYALEAARQCLGPEAVELLDDDNWRFEGRWNPRTSRFESTLSAAKPMACTLEGNDITIKRGERVYVVESGKWTKADVAGIFAQQELVISDWWNYPEVDYGIYWLQRKQQISSGDPAFPL